MTTTSYYSSTWRADLANMSAADLERCVDQLTHTRQERMEELARLQQDLAAIERGLSIAQEVQAERRCETDPAFLERWRELLDTTSGSKDRSDRLHKAFDEFLDSHRRPYLRGAWTIRRDNRQAVLCLFVPSDPEVVELAHHALLSLLPVLVNEANPDPQAQAAVVTVMSRDQSDKEMLNLVAHPRLGRYELTHSWRSEETVEHRTNSLREMLQYLAERHPYY